MRDMRFRLRFLGVAIALAIALTCATYIVTVNVNGARWINRANNTRLADARKTTVQGGIFDTRNVMLAESFAPAERHYTDDSQARLALSHVIGDQANMTDTGVENFHASTLLGFSSAKTELQKLVGSEPVGNDIILTVDTELSKYLNSLFPKGASGAAVIINYKTGAILASTSLPGFDPADMKAAVADSAYYNRVFQKLYAPGSTFKIITLASALDNEPTAESETYTCGGVWSYSMSTLRCAGLKAHGKMTLSEAFANSCNVTFGELAYHIGANELKRSAEGFGFNYDFRFADIKLNESHCLTNGTDAGDLIQAGIGQGTTEVTPLHMAMIAGAVANKGVMMEPKIIKEVRDASGMSVRTLSPTVFRNALSKETAEKVARYMYDAVNTGTGKSAKITGYKDGAVCGKTGSAEWTNDKDALTHAWYAGFLYGDENHPYAIAVVVEKAGMGGTVAAPIASKALKKCIDLNLQ